MSNSNEIPNVQKQRDPKIMEEFKKLEKENLNNIQSELNEKYNFFNNVRDIMSSAQKAVENKCSVHMAEFQKYAIVDNERMKAGQRPLAKPGKEREFETTFSVLEKCQKPIVDKLNNFNNLTEIMNAFSSRSSEFCIDDCEENFNKNKNNPNFDISHCMKDCFRGIKYNSFTLGKFVQSEKHNIVNSFNTSQI